MLMGEKSPGFGGATRDMWNPTCAGNAGKVSDAEYFCGFDDGGGVHSNSGVTNHTYALAVDGGTYNGQTLDGLGLDKAAAIWFRAQSHYLTPVVRLPRLRQRAVGVVRRPHGSAGRRAQRRGGRGPGAHRPGDGR